MVRYFIADSLNRPLSVRFALLFIEKDILETKFYTDKSEALFDLAGIPKSYGAKLMELHYEIKEAQND